MLALPIARRELLVLSRVSGTWQKRLVASIAVFGFGIIFALVYHFAGQMALTQAMHFLGVGLSLSCLFAGVSLTADSIAEEKRLGTIGLLFLTHLSPFEIVMGKLAAHAVLGFYTLLCAAPLLSMSMIFGGMALGNAVFYMMSALNLLFFSTAAGLLASSVSREKKRAASMGSLIVVFLWAGLPLIALLLRWLGAPGESMDVFAWLSVNLPIGIGMGFGRLMPSVPMWWKLLWPHILGWSFIGLAIWFLPRQWQEESSAKPWRLRDMWKAISHGTSATRLALRRKLLDRNPFQWLASRDRFQAASVWILTIALMSFMAVLLSRVAFEPGVVIGFTAALVFLQQAIFSGAAGAQLFREYEQGTLELVLSTPLPVREVIRGQFVAARKQYRLLFALTFCLLLAGLVMLAWQGGFRRLYGIIFLAAASPLFLLQVYTLGWVGMWCIVKAPEPKRAHATAFLLVTIFPGLMFGLLMSAVQFLNWLAGWRWGWGPLPVISALFIIAYGNCIYWLRRARRELPHELRPFAFRRYSPQEQTTIFGRLGRFVGRVIHALSGRQSWRVAR